MALPKYPQLKKKIENMLLDYFQREAQKELGPFEGARRFVQHEGKTFVHNTMDNTGKKKELNYVEAKTEYLVKYADIPNMGAEDVIKMLQEKAKEFGGQQAKHNYKVLNQVTEETGNVVHGNNEPFNIDMFFEVIEKIQIEFDEFGNPNMPTMVVSSSGAERAKIVMQEAENDPETKRRMEELIARKRKEYDAAQARRKLVD